MASFFCLNVGGLKNSCKFVVLNNITMTTKVCNRCNQEKSINEFHKTTQRSDGRKLACRTCINAAQRKRRNGTEVPKTTRAKYNVAPNSHHINQRRKVTQYDKTATAIQEGKKEDDFTNHFFSHFGFFDIAHDLDRQTQRPLQSYSLNGHKARESYGVGTRYQSK